MRVLHVISGDLWAGAEVQAFTLLATLQRQPGVEVAVALLNEGELAQRLRDRGIKTDVLPESRLGTRDILGGLRRLMRTWRPEVIHTHRIKENILGCIANTLSGKVPSVRTAHGVGEHSTRGLVKMHKRLLRSLDVFCGRYLQKRVIAVSGELAEQLARDYPRNHITVIENGIDIEGVLSHAHRVDLAATHPGATHVGIVGRLVPVKRVDLFLAMARELQQKDPARHWHFHVFGDGPLLGTLQGQAQSLGIGDSTTFHGHRADIIACIATLDALVMCSDHEGLPMTALESLVTGTPLVAHAVGGLTALLQGWADDALVHVHSAGEYAEGCLRVLRKSREEYRRDCAHSLAHRSAQANCTQVLTLYREILQTP